MSLTIHSSIKSELKRKLLLRGSAIAGIGALILLIAGATVPPQDLSIWGWPIIIVSFGLIALGLIPYRRLCRLEDKPSKLVLTDDNEIIYIVNDRKRVTIPYDSIEKMEHLKNSNIYGIGLWLKKNNNLKPVVHDPLFNAIGHQKIAQKRFGCDLFLPFFSERALAELQ